MAAFRTGDTLVWIIGPVQDDSGNAVTGATWSAVVAIKPDGTTFSPTYTDLGNGDYKATVVSDQRGLWFLHSTATVSGVVYTDAGSFTVDDELAYTASGSAGTVGAALANLDAAVSTRLATAGYAPSPDPLAASLAAYTTPGTAGANLAALTTARSANLDLITAAVVTVRSPSVAGLQSTNLDATRGDAWIRTATVPNQNGGPFDFTGASLTWKLRHWYDPEDAALIALDWTDGGASHGIAIADPRTGVVTITLTPVQTETLTDNVAYRWGLRVTDANGVVTTEDTGTLLMHAP